MLETKSDNSNLERLRLPDDLPERGRLNAGLKSALRNGILRTASPLYRFLRRPPAGSFGILMYHRVTPRVPGVPFPTWNVTPKRFRRQVTGLLKRSFQPRPLRDLLAMHQNGVPIPPKTFAMTFDDGYANNFLHAWPILRELEVPATIFLATAYLDSERPFPNDDWSAAGSRRVSTESWRPMTTAQCRRLREHDLVELGAHTHTHADFRNRPTELEADLKTCAAVLREKFGIERPTFAFPYGTKHLGFSGPVLAAAAQRAGVACGLTTEREIVRPDHNPFDWGRFTATQHDTAGTLAVKLTGGFEAMRALFHTFQRTKARS